MKQIDRVDALVKRISIKFFGYESVIMVKYDIIADNPSKFNPIHEPRVFIQIEYASPNTNTGKIEYWKGRKWYLSEFMTDDEIIKTVYLAFETCVKHEVLESFKVDGIILFNPHVNFEELLKISHKEVKRN